MAESTTNKGRYRLRISRRFCRTRNNCRCSFISTRISSICRFKKECAWVKIRSIARTICTVGLCAKPAQSKIEGVKGMSSNQQFIEATISYYANTDHTWFRFVPGVGITSYIFGHHGSVSEAELKLVEFHLGR